MVQRPHHKQVSNAATTTCGAAKRDAATESAVMRDASVEPGRPLGVEVWLALDVQDQDTASQDRLW
jgi:hypothetical protein